MKKIIFTLVTMLLFGNLYAYEINRCTGCHGAKFEIKALSKSKIVSDMGEIEIAEVLKAYKNGTYGGAYKIMMTAQVRKYSDTDLEAMAKEIKSMQ